MIIEVLLVVYPRLLFTLLITLPIILSLYYLGTIPTNDL